VIRANTKLQVAEEAAAQKAEEAHDRLQEARGRLEIREGTRGHPLGHNFVHHCRTLLATGASARATRDQLLLNGRFFLRDKDYTYFMDQMPEVRWFQFQREGTGLESMVLTFMRLAKAERVHQWGFDETSLDGVPTLNQWCRIVEENETITLTIECAGLLPGNPPPYPNPDSSSNPYPIHLTLTPTFTLTLNCTLTLNQAVQHTKSRSTLRCCGRGGRQLCQWCERH
jgi:hypothetical protein